MSDTQKSDGLLSDIRRSLTLSAAWLNRHFAIVLTSAVLLAVGGAKLRLIASSGSDLPWGDQWYGEMERTYKPWLESGLGFKEVFSPHNEHRIVFTRLLDILLLKINGQWAPRMQLVVNVLILLAALAVLLRQAGRHLSPMRLAVFSGLSAILFGSASLWENTLCGFQSQFYFLLLFSLIHLLLTISGRPFSLPWWIGHIAGLCNLFTMAPGLISAIAVLGWLGWQRFFDKKLGRGDAFTTIWNLTLFVLGWALLPDLVHSDHSGHVITELGRSFLHLLSWPIVKWELGLLVWAPILVFIFTGVTRSKSDQDTSWIVGLSILSLLFVTITALARGGLASRYADLFSIGILTNLLCLMKCQVKGRKLVALSVASGFWVMSIVQGLWKQEELAYSVTLNQLSTRQEAVEESIRLFLTNGDIDPLQQNEQISSLDIEVLKNIRATPALRAILPFSLRAPLELGTFNPENGFRLNGVPMLENSARNLPVLGSWAQPETATMQGWKSPVLTAQGAFLVFFVAGEINPPLTELFLETTYGEKITPLQQVTLSPERWRRVNFPIPNSEFQIVASDRSTNHWLAFSAPVELSSGSWITSKVLSISTWIYFTGWILLIGTAFIIFAEWISNTRPQENSTEPAS